MTFDLSVGFNVADKIKLNTFVANGGDIWHSMTLLNSWVDYGSPFQGCRYKKDMWDRVWVEGVCKSGTITDATIIFTFPTEPFNYTPVSGLFFVAQHVDTITKPCYLYLNSSNGSLYIYSVLANTRLAFSFSYEAVR